MNPISSMSSKGQFTMPQAVRARMGLRPGDKVEFVFLDGHTVIKPVRIRKRSFAEWAGAFPAFDTTEERQAWFDDLRGDHPGHYE